MSRKRSNSPAAGKNSLCHTGKKARGGIRCYPNESYQAKRLKSPVNCQYPKDCVRSQSPVARKRLRSPAASKNSSYRHNIPEYEGWAQFFTNIVDGFKKRSRSPAASKKRGKRAN